MSAGDFYELRRQGIGFIAEMGSDHWTDYNTHDPGITILEAFSYAMTELSYRTALPIADLLASAAPYSDQAFPTARQILTINPVTPDDLRRLLIDLDTVRNAWLDCRPGGLYDVALDLDGDEEAGDLADRTLAARRTVPDPAGVPHELTLELRFPAIPFPDGPALSTITVTLPVDDDTLRGSWRGVFDVGLQIGLADGSTLAVDAALRVFGDREARAGTTVAAIRDVLADTGPGGLVDRYRRRVLAAGRAVAAARAVLHRHRALAEDLHRVRPIEVEDIAVCADVEIRADADVEAVQAAVWFAIERYLNPPIAFHTVAELLAAGLGVEEIFNGPQMSNGYVTPGDLAAAALRTDIRVSDLIDLLMEIPGVLTVENVLLTTYDDRSRPAGGSAPWLLPVSPGRRPNLYRSMSRFRFTAGGLPFVPRTDEAESILTQLRGAAARPKLPADAGDLPPPAGTARDVGAYLPIQHAFPLTYGIGPAGLPATAPPPRRAQAKQLKAYLLVFDQMLRDRYTQLAHLPDLFSLAAQEHTYFTEPFTAADLAGYADLTSGLDAATLAGLAESAPEFAARRNRFLDHLLARFGEQFAEYALLLTSLEGQRTAQLDLIADKAAFLRAHPRISHDRGRAANHAEAPCLPGNVAGLQRRVSLLLGHPDLALVWHANAAGESLVLRGPDTAFPVPATVTTALSALLTAHAPLPPNWAITQTGGQLWWHTGDPVDDVALGDALADAERAILAQLVLSADRTLATWSANERAVLVEHLLLRPKFPGDVTGCDDSYAFRLTWVMPGWTAPFNTDMQMRDFAEHTIRQETPAHLIVKICWVGNDGYVPDPCDPVLDEFAALLGDDCSCATAVRDAFGTAFETWYAGKELQPHQPDAVRAQLTTALSAVDLSAASCANPIDGDTATALRAVAVDHFAEIAVHGRQFERFEDAWCRWWRADARIDWTTQDLTEAVESHLGADPTEILTLAGTAFAQWRDTHVAEGRAFTDFPPFDPGPLPVGAALRALLIDRYTAYAEVSYRLRLLTDALDTLRNTYPGAHLHDCDQGGDRNPIRLNRTALGSNTP
ncbi:hypothetical protein [Actinoplanes sp. NPDC026670]|uniref:hypothetical protein n=1 Tax=Actinoplanes sp. NPDC026670 TaxID=3154700 RepID=UPI0033DB4E68